MTSDEYTFRALGQFVLIAAAATLVLFVANIRARFYYDAMNLSDLGYLVVYGVVVGYGLTQIKKWAAVLLAVPLALFGGFVGIRAVMEQPTPLAAFLALFWTAMLLIPSVLTIRRWRILR